MTAIGVKRLFAVLFLIVAAGAFAGCAGAGGSGMHAGFAKFDGGGGI